jgi:hypothetical protein
MTAVKLPRIKSSLPIVDSQGRVNNLFLRALNEVIEAAESQIGALQAAVDAQAAAASAAASAATANTAATNVTNATALANSFVTGLTITATDAGSNATITISGHTRNYADGTSVSVTGGSITALAYSTDYWIYYDQASRAGGTVTYVASASVVGNGTAPDRHFVGAVRTPAGGGGPSNGNPVVPPGYAQP